jgi:hypothetical protein
MTGHTLVAIVVLGLPVLAAAQPADRATPTAPPASALAPIALPLPQIGLPLPPIGLPLPPIGLQSPPSEQRRSLSSQPAGTHAQGSRSGERGRFRSAPTVVYFGVPYMWGVDPRSQAAAPGIIVSEVASAIAPSHTGRLRLDVHPADVLQLFVDGQYVGTADDVGDELELEPGSRRIEIRAPGYETLAFDARIVAQRTITYRGSLQPIAAATPGDSVPARDRTPPPPLSEPLPPAPAQTFYFIPGCYMGNVPPHEVRLPPDCDLSRLITRTP